jgi:hypothetical protein
MEKKEAQVLQAARDALLTVADERDTALVENTQLKDKLASVRQRLECEKLAAEMFEKGINTDQDFESLVEDLEKAAGEGRLPILQEAVKMSAPQMGAKIAHINNDDETSGVGSSQLEQYLVGSVG